MEGYSKRESFSERTADVRFLAGLGGPKEPGTES